MINELILAMPGAAGKQGGAGGFSFLIMMVLMIVIMYFIVYRPQMKQRKKLEQAIKEMKKGDRVLTSGGIYGTIAGVKDNIAVIEIAKGVKIELNKAMISRILVKE